MGGAFWKLGAGKRVVTCRVRGQACSIQLGQPDCRHVGGRGRVRASAREAPRGSSGPGIPAARGLLPPSSPSHSSGPLPHFFLPVAPLNSPPVYSFKITLNKLVQRELHPCTPTYTLPVH